MKGIHDTKTMAIETVTGTLLHIHEAGTKGTNTEMKATPEATGIVTGGHEMTVVTETEVGLAVLDHPLVEGRETEVTQKTTGPEGGILVNDLWSMTGTSGDDWSSPGCRG